MVEYSERLTLSRQLHPNLTLQLASSTASTVGCPLHWSGLPKMADAQTTTVTRRVGRSLCLPSVLALLDPIEDKFTTVTAIANRVVREACMMCFDALLEETTDDDSIVRLIEHQSDLFDHAACKSLAYVSLFLFIWLSFGWLFGCLSFIYKVYDNACCMIMSGSMQCNASMEAHNASKVLPSSNA